MTDFITEADLASYLRRTIPTNGAALVVELANGLVGDIWGDVAPAPTRVKAITLEVAARGYRNPEGLSSEQTSIDDYDKIVRREGPGMPAPGVYLTDTEKDELRDLRLGALGTPRRRVGSIRLGVKSAT